MIYCSIMQYLVVYVYVKKIKIIVNYGKDNLFIYMHIFLDVTDNWLYQLL